VAGTIVYRLSTLLICLVVVGASIAIISRSMVSELTKPATDDGSLHRATVPVIAPQPSKLRRVERVAAAIEIEGPMDWWARVRSGAALVGIVATLGLGLAIAVGLGVFAGLSAIRDALG